MALKVGSIVDGTVINITNFGAFVELEGRITGLVHISEVADTFVKDIRTYLKEQDKIRVKVISIDDNGKISLSIKHASVPIKSSKPVEIDWTPEKAKVPTANFEDRLSKFMKDSEERISDVKKHQESKVKGGYSRRSSGF